MWSVYMIFVFVFFAWQALMDIMENIQTNISDERNISEFDLFGQSVTIDRIDV